MSNQSDTKSATKPVARAADQAAQAQRKGGEGVPRSPSRRRRDTSGDVKFNHIRTSATVTEDSFPSSIRWTGIANTLPLPKPAKKKGAAA